MQKKKPPFQVIPNYSVSGLGNWNESKEVPAEQGWNDKWPTQLLRLLQACSVRLIAIANYRDEIANWPNSEISQENGATQ